MVRIRVRVPVRVRRSLRLSIRVSAGVRVYVLPSHPTMHRARILLALSRRRSGEPCKMVPHPS